MTAPSVTLGGVRTSRRGGSPRRVLLDAQGHEVTGARRGLAVDRGGYQRRRAERRGGRPQPEEGLLAVEALAEGGAGHPGGDRGVARARAGHHHRERVAHPPGVEQPRGGVGPSGVGGDRHDGGVADERAARTPAGSRRPRTGRRAPEGAVGLGRRTRTGPGERSGCRHRERQCGTHDRQRGCGDAGWRGRRAAATRPTGSATGALSAACSRVSATAAGSAPGQPRARRGRGRRRGRRPAGARGRPGAARTSATSTWAAGGDHGRAPRPTTAARPGRRARSGEPARAPPRARPAEPSSSARVGVPVRRAGRRVRPSRRTGARHRRPRQRGPEHLGPGGSRRRARRRWSRPSAAPVPPGADAVARARAARVARRDAWRPRTARASAPSTNSSKSSGTGSPASIAGSLDSDAPNGAQPPRGPRALGDTGAHAALHGTLGRPAPVGHRPRRTRRGVGALHPAGAVAHLEPAPARGRLPGCRGAPGHDRPGHRGRRGGRGVPHRRGRPRGPHLVVERALRPAAGVVRPRRRRRRPGSGHVGGSRAWLVTHALWPVALGYAPLARLALGRLVAASG